MIYDTSRLTAGRFWELDVKVTEVDGGSRIEDTLELDITARHLLPPIAPPHDKDERPSSIFLSKRVFLGSPGDFVDGIQRFTYTDLQPHLPTHSDTMTVSLFVDYVEAVGHIKSYFLEVDGLHRASPVPVPGAVWLMLSAIAATFAMKSRKRA